MEMQPKTRLDLDDEPRFLGPEFELPSEKEFTVGVVLEEDERERYDEQILAALVSP